MRYILLLFLPILICSWRSTGHMLVAAIAQARLLQINSSIHAKFRDLVLSINDLADEKSQTFIEAASWPDDIKQNYNMTIWNDWHYFNQVYVPDGIYPSLNYTLNSYQAVTLLSEAMNVISINRDSNSAERALFSRYLLHVVGDIHQPLHAIALFNETYKSGDRGGNSLNVIRTNGEETNLHSFWDNGAFLLQNQTYTHQRPMNKESWASLIRLAGELVKDYGKTLQGSALDLEPENWAKESFSLAKQFVYPLLFKTNKLTQEYTSVSYELCKRQITLAGFRLANLIVTLYDGNMKLKDSKERLKELNGEYIKIQYHGPHKISDL